MVEGHFIDQQDAGGLGIIVRRSYTGRKPVTWNGQSESRNLKKNVSKL